MPPVRAGIGLSVVWNYDEVEALQEDRESLYRANSIGVQGGWMKVGEARERARLPVEVGDDIYLRSTSVRPVSDETIEAGEGEPWPTSEPSTPVADEPDDNADEG